MEKKREKQFGPSLYLLKTSLHARDIRSQIQGGGGSSSSSSKLENIDVKSGGGWVETVDIVFLFFLHFLSHLVTTRANQRVSRKATLNLLVENLCFFIYSAKNVL